MRHQWKFLDSCGHVHDIPTMPVSYLKRAVRVRSTVRAVRQRTYPNKKPDVQMKKPKT